MTKRLSGKTALITGAGVGIGRAVALALASAGAKIAITYRTHEPDSSFVARVREVSGSTPVCVELEATSESAVQNAIRVVSEQLGPLNVLVNNIGGLVRRSLVEDMDFALWREVIALNLDSAFLVTHHSMNVLERSGGRIINIASLAARNGGHAGATAYAAAKSALFGFTRGLAKELGPLGTTVNAIAPGFIEATPFHDTFTTAESKTATISTIPVGRAGNASDVASAALWLSLPESSFVNGAVIDVNGGQYFG